MPVSPEYVKIFMPRIADPKSALRAMSKPNSPTANALLTKYATKQVKKVQTAVKVARQTGPINKSVNTVRVLKDAKLKPIGHW